jgi:hypothetical protein
MDGHKTVPSQIYAWALSKIRDTAALKTKVLIVLTTVLAFAITAAAILSCMETGLVKPVPIRKTNVTIMGEQFFINGRTTYKGRYWNGHKIEGLLFNSRMVQGIFDDANPETRACFKYPDTGTWDPERNTDEFVAAMDDWYNHGLLAFTLNLQGGNPRGCGSRGWINSAFDRYGNLKPGYLKRLEKILDKADAIGMVVILGYFYFGQDEQLNDEQAVIRAVDNMTMWIIEKDYRNIIIEISNECDVKRYDHKILRAQRVHELIERVKTISGKRLLVSASFGGGTIPHPNIVETADFLLLHGNNVDDPLQITEMIQLTRRVPGYTPKPIIFNEDNHFDFDAESNNLLSAVGSYASWGFLDFRMAGEGFESGYQSVPVDWRIGSKRKIDFFCKIKEITGY